MGPYNPKRQLERAERVARLLEQDDLSDWAENFWTGVLRNLSINEDQYNHRVVQLYKDRARTVIK